MFDSLAPSVLDGVNFIAGAIVPATSVTSHVIYGLRCKVREALWAPPVCIHDVARQ
jgi:hypothetical protein